MTDETVFDGYVNLSKKTGTTDGYIDALRARIRELESEREQFMQDCLRSAHNQRITELETALREVSGTSKYVVAREMRHLALQALSSVEDK